MFAIMNGTDVLGFVLAIADDVAAFKIGTTILDGALPERPDEGQRCTSSVYQGLRYSADPQACGYRSRRRRGHTCIAVDRLEVLTEAGHDAPDLFQAFQQKTVPLEGKTEVVNGTRGGVGDRLVQLARWQGTQVVAVVSAKNAELMHQLLPLRRLYQGCGRGCYRRCGACR